MFGGKIVARVIDWKLLAIFDRPIWNPASLMVIAGW